MQQPSDHEAEMRAIVQLGRALMIVMVSGFLAIHAAIVIFGV